MPSYSFKNKNGRVIERVYTMEKVPKTVRVGHHVYHRQLGLGVAAIVHGQPHLARSCPRQWTPGLAEHYDKWNPLGVAVVEGQADQRRFADALKRTTKTQRASWVYDPL